MEHEFTIPIRVVEVTDEDDDIDTGDSVPPAPAATDDGTPIRPVATPAEERSR